MKRQSEKRIYRMDCRLNTHNATQYNFGIKTNLFNDDKNCLLLSWRIGEILFAFFSGALVKG